MVVIGAGSWGTALAIQLARAGSPTLLWGRDGDAMRKMAAERENVRYLPGAAFPDLLDLTEDFERVATGSHILVTVPSHAFRALLEALRAVRERKDLGPPHLAWATKGFEQDTGLLPHQVVLDVWPECRDYAVVSGPTFAREVGIGLPTAITVSGSNPEWSRYMADALRSHKFIAYTSSDIIGVEIGGAVKNALAIGAGLSDGLGFGANARIALINRGLRELSRLGLALGAEQQTFVGLAGMGDLVLTCTDDQSRNRRMGLALARGATVEQAAEDIGQVVEGIGAARTVYEKAQSLGISMPIIEQIHRVVIDGVSPHEAVVALLDRELGAGAEH
ncbi:MAG: glycerol-3-phosphate dehydrogenase [Gammaproteobacteria bacterium]|nr:MAG: glycerol-3-phosphate dehydrogenase [Gammaproteobacteria bacterium]PIE36804.1 MAG: glycerol-3-phosphate dehydrogenase [Gammaproteobacteria bacterium]